MTERTERSTDFDETMTVKKSSFVTQMGVVR